MIGDWMGKLTSSEQETIELRLEGNIYVRIHEYISQKGYIGWLRL